MEQEKYKLRYDWRNTSTILITHSLSLYGFWLIFTLNVKWQTLLFNWIYYIIMQIGVLGGAHRLWSHRAFKAKKPLRYFLVLAQTAALEKDVFQWAREHRVHHKHVDTDADPHNSNRGFFFCHIGWYMVKKHPDVITKGRQIDLSDVASDPVVIFQRKYYFRLAFLLIFILPTIIQMYFWQETFTSSIFATLVRMVLVGNGTATINSFAHFYGYKPYDKSINPTENLFVSIASCGEGWHNYHHTFPWDYKAAELPNYTFNFTTAFIDLMALIGQAYDLKTVSKDMVRKTALKKGDGSWNNINEKHSPENNVWGWGDKDMPNETKDGAVFLHRKKLNKKNHINEN